MRFVSGFLASVCLIPIFLSGKTFTDVKVDGKSAHPTRILACYKDASQGFLNNGELEKLGLAEKERLKIVSGLVVFDEAQSNNVVSQPIDEEALVKNLTNRISALKKTGLFRYVEPDWIKKAHLTPNDTAFTDGRLWGLNNTGQSGGIAGADINAVSAWNVTTGTSSVIVAIIDSGVRYTHADLSANMWKNPGEIPGNGIDDDNDGYVDDVYGINAITGSGNPFDDDGHGTHTAGIIGAAANNGQPNVGVAWKVSIMACKFLDASGGGKISDELKCIDYAISKGARILNMSFGDNAFSQAEYEALQKALQKNVLIVASAGNEGVNNDLTPTYPANYNLGNIISVAAFNRYNQLASFSNYGNNTVHIAAPGEEIFSCWNGSDYDYKTLNGTSMAAPHVSGVAALVVSIFPEIGVYQLRSQLLQSAVPVQSMNGKLYTGGRIDAFKSLNAAPNGILEVVVAPPDGTLLSAGSTVNLVLNISDVYPITNATVSGTTSFNTTLTFLNYGTNSLYSTTFQVPALANTVSVSISITAPGKTGTNFSLTYPVAMPPSNDDFYKSALIVNTTNIVLTAVNELATKQNGEPDHLGNSGGKSLWWTYIPPSSGIVSISTDGSDFDTLLAVYTGDNISNLVLVAGNDDFSKNSTPQTSKVYFSATNGVSYHIAVDGYAGASGNVKLTLNLDKNLLPPPNDNFANRLTLSGESVFISGTNIGATIEANEPSHSGRQGGASVWYSWTAQFSGQVDINTVGSDFDTLLGVYTGSSIDGLIEVAANDDIDSQNFASEVKFYVSQGTTYQIAIDGYEAGCGTYFLSINRMSGGSTVPNDMFTNATVISSTTIIGSNVGATKEAGEPNHGGDVGGCSVWYKWTAPSNTIVVISTEGSDFDTLLAVYTGTSLQTLALIGENDDDYYGSEFSTVTFNAISSQVYYIAVDGYAYSGFGTNQGTIKLSILPISPPANDNFENRIMVSGGFVNIEGANYGASSQNNEHYHCGYSPSRSVWYQWVAPASGYTMISTEGSSFDTLLGVYTNTTLADLVAVAGSDDGLDDVGPSKTYFFAQAGVSYQIAVDGYSGSSGSISLHIAQNYSLTNVYYTGFKSTEGFTVGRSVAGVGGWQCNFSGGNGILANRFPNRDQQAYIGYSPNYGSSSGVVYLWRPINYSPPTNGIVVYSVYMSITGSTDIYYDIFGWSVYNSAGDLLFTVDFDNYSFGIYYTLDDGEGYYSANLDFENNTIYNLKIFMDFNSNKWSAYLNSVPITESQPITTQGANLDLGDIDAMWIWQDIIIGGDNFMLFDDYTIDVISELKPPSILASPQSQSLMEGENLVLTVSADGASPLYYQWFFNGTPISGAVSSNLTFLNVTTNHSGIYSVVVFNLIGTTSSAPATVLVRPKVTPPPNDNFANSIRLIGDTNFVRISNVGATREAGEPLHCGNIGGSSVWYKWTAPYSGRFVVSTIGSDFDTLLTIYKGSSLDNLTSVAYNDDVQINVRASWLYFDAINNQEYYFAIDGFNGASGNIVLTIKSDVSSHIVQWRYDLNIGFNAVLNADPGLNYTVQATTNFVNWVPVTNIFNSTGQIRFNDYDKTNSYKFYRVILSQ